MTLTAEPVAASDALTAPRWVAPLLGLRRCGLPASASTDHGFSTALSLAGSAEDQRDLAASLTEQLSADLYRLVPSLEDSATRRAAVRLRRAVHNGRWDDGTQRDLRLVAPRLDGDAAARLTRWQDAVTRAGRLEEAARVRCDELVVERGRTLVERLRRPDLLASLALASPTFARDLLQQNENLAPQSRLARSAQSYLTRCAVKTSPFGHLTSLAYATFEPLGLPVSAPAQAHSAFRPLAVDLLRALASHHVTCDAFRLAAPDELVRLDDELVTLKSLGLHVRGFFYAEDDHVALRAETGLAETLSRMPGEVRDVAGWQEALGLSRDEVRRLVAVGLLRPVVSWDGDLIADLARAVGRVPRAGAVAAALGELAEAFRDAHGPDPLRRTESDTQVRQAAGRVYGELGRPRPPWLSSAPLFHEAVTTGGASPSLPTTVVEDLAAVRNVLTGSLRPDPLYQAICDAFTRWYGAGGTCDSALKFLLRFVRDPGFLRLMTGVSRSLVEAVDGAAPQRLPAPGDTVLPPTATVFFQLAASGTAQLRQGRHRLVLNRVNAGPGGLLARWTSVPGLRGPVIDRLGPWLQGLGAGPAGDVEVLQLTSSDDWTSVQRVDPTLARIVGWPAALPSSYPRERVVPLADLALRHDPHHGRLTLYQRRTGQPVAVAYMGVVPVHLLSGPARLLACLGSPWVVDLRVDGEARPYDPPARPPERLERTPRTEVGRVVLSRERWRLPAALFPAGQGKHETYLVYLRRVNAWRTAHGLPARCFARCSSGAALVERKPFWLDFSDPFSLHALFPAVRRAEVVTLFEALPGPDDHPFADEDGAHARELVAVLSIEGVPEA